MWHWRLASVFPIRQCLPAGVQVIFPVVEIFCADIIRDGGSRCFCYHSDAGNWYEFHMRFIGDVDGKASYDSPMLYLKSVNEGNVVHEFTWDEALHFVSSLHFDNLRFAELVEIVSNRGAPPTAA